MTRGCPRVVEALRFIWIRIELERLATRDGDLRVSEPSGPRALLRAWCDGIAV